jgi:hypothetical protein
MERDDSPSSEQSSSSPRRRKLLRWGVVGLGVAVALIAWLATRGSGEGERSSTTQAPRIVSEGELAEAAAELGQPIYWAGPLAGRELELRELGEGQGVQVAYLPEGAAVGEGPTSSLTVGSYPVDDPGAAVEGYARRAGSRTLHGDGGLEVVVSGDAPDSVYFAAPDNSVQVEVYDPSPKRALTLALSGGVKPAE